MPFVRSETAPSRVTPHSRVALALACAAVDSRARKNVIAFGSTVQSSFVEHDYVQDILDESATAWGELTSHPFPTELARGTAPLNGFRHYMIQDATYLEYYYRVRMESVAQTGSFEEITDFAAKLSSSLEYVTEARDDCTNKLGVPAGDVVGEGKSEQLQNSINLYEYVVKNGDWLDIHIVLLPCILGYYTIASALLRSPDTVRNTLYFPMWIQANAGGSSATKYRTFINNNIGNLSEEERTRRWPIWVDYFQRACGTEKAFFGLATPGVFPAYNIVSNGTYKIRSYRRGNPYLAAVGTSVITQAGDPGSDGLWTLTNTVDGYAIQNTGKYLNAAIGTAIQPVYDASVSEVQQQWSINPVEVYNASGSYQAYQLFVPGTLQFVLDSGNDVNRPEAFVANNSEISSQLWVLESVA